ncbi:hypothetical protein ACS0TY_025042 [Phlomoides rotata]
MKKIFLGGYSPPQPLKRSALGYDVGLDCDLLADFWGGFYSVLGLPVAPALAVVFLGDKLTGLKGVAMWGFVSYIYQHYLDDLKMKAEEEVSGPPLVNERGSIVAS